MVSQLMLTDFLVSSKQLIFQRQNLNKKQRIVVKVGSSTITHEATGNINFAKLEKLGVKTVICTDISRDGVMQGTNLSMYRKLTDTYHMDLIASGGVSTIEDVKALRAMELHGAIIGKAYYIGAIDLKEAVEVAK